MKWYAVVLGSTCLVVATACAPKEEPVAEEAAAPAEEMVAPVGGVTAEAVLQGRPDSGLSGTVHFTAGEGGVTVVADIQGATPGTHGLHIHEVGDCSAEDFTSAGGHFNPGGTAHGCPADAERHAGDLGNIEIGEDGTGHLELVSDLIDLGDGATSVIGRGVIFHADADDCVTQPTGGAGARAACAVVTTETTEGEDLQEEGEAAEATESEALE